MQIKLPKGAVRNGAIVGGIAAVVVFAIVGGLRFVIPSQARPGDDRQEIAQNIQGNCNNVGNYNFNCNTVNVGP